jgi:hypothetical protein
MFQHLRLKIAAPQSLLERAVSLLNLRIGAKLAVAVLVPLVGLVGLAGYDLADKWRTRAQMAELGSLAEGAKAASRLIHELQRERGLSAIFASAKGAQMAAELPAQRKATDAQRSAAIDVLNRLRASAASGSFRDAIGKFQAALAGLDERRKAIDALAIAAPESSAFFTDVIARLLAITAEISKISSRGDVTTAISAYLAFSQGKERAGQERAAAGSGIAAGRFDPALYQRVLGLAAIQQTYFDLFEAAASAPQREFYQQTMSGAGDRHCAAHAPDHRQGRAVGRALRHRRQVVVRCGDRPDRPAEAC